MINICDLESYYIRTLYYTYCYFLVVFLTIINNIHPEKKSPGQQYECNLKRLIFFINIFRYI